MGKRTKFQVKSLAQLVVMTKRTNCENDDGTGTLSEGRTKPVSLPKDVPLDNEVLLNQMKMAEGEEVPQAKLKDYEQSLLMAVW
jgi:hypothetical protein